MTTADRGLEGLPGAEELFGKSGAVILEESERHWFDEIYQRDDYRLWWFAFAWRSIRDGMTHEEAERIRQRHPTSPGSSYWVVDSRVQWGPLQGGGEQEWWSWNEERAEFLETSGRYSCYRCRGERGKAGTHVRNRSELFLQARFVKLPPEGRKWVATSLLSSEHCSAPLAIVVGTPERRKQ